MACEYLRLDTIVDIKTGAPMSRAKKLVDGDVPTDVRVLVPAAFSCFHINYAQLPIETVSRVKEDLFTREGDVIVKSSTPYDCVYIDKDHEGLLVTSFGLILRSNSKSQIDMRYLAAYLSLEQTNKEFQSMSKGMTIQLLKKRDIGDLIVPVPSAEEQARLGALSESVQRYKDLCRTISEKSDLLLQSEFARIVQAIN